MPLTPFHGLIPYFLATIFTKEKRYWLVAFIGGVLPDLDGIPILFDLNLFYLIHHELFHQPIYGIILAIPVVFIAAKYFKMDKLKTAVLFAGGFALHGLTDVLFTNWPVKLLWPFSSEQFSSPMFIEYNFLLAASLTLLLILQFYRIWKKN